MGIDPSAFTHAKLPLKSTCYHTFLESQEKKKNSYFTPTKRKKKLFA